MLTCKNCGAALHYDIEKKDLACSKCDSHFPIGEAGKESVALVDDEYFQDAGEDDKYGVTVFTCPLCGGRIYSYQNEATEFCRFCGASVTLEGRITSAKEPKYIVPFKVTKEKCVDTFRNHIKKLPLVPPEMKRDDIEDKFCGVYIPFFLYEVSQEGKAYFNASKYKGKDVIHYKVTVDIDTHYENIAYDASSFFDDSLARELAPFSMYSSQPFNTGYLCGFYADIADVNPDVYREKVLAEAMEHTIDTMALAHSDLQGMSFEQSHKECYIPNEITNLTSALLPVWFITWRMKNRVSYTAVNGSNGKIIDHIPIDEKKFLLKSLWMGVVAALALYFLLPVIPGPNAVRIIYFLASLGAFFYFDNSHAMMIRDLHLEDAGLTGKLAGYRNRAKERKSIRNGVLLVGGLILYVLVMSLMKGEVELFKFIMECFSHIDIALFILAIGLELYVHLRIHDDYTTLKDKKVLFDTWLLLPAAGLSVAVLACQPESDIYYYMVCIVSGLYIMKILIDVIRQYNRLSTHPIPQLHNRKRGEGLE